jgi:DNA-binding GntR family transcriptional regulator
MGTLSENLTLASRVYGVVRRRILRGSLLPGSPISRRTLAAELHTSVLPVTEALQRLELEGLLESRPRAGTRVRVPSEEDVRGHYVVREALEVQAARLVTALATPLELERLAALARQIDTLGAVAGRARYSILHHAFHRTIATCSRCPALLDAIDRSHALATLWWCGPSGDTTCHQELVDAIATRDVTIASEAMARHVAVGLEMSLAALKAYFPLHGADQVFPREYQRRDHRRGRL